MTSGNERFTFRSAVYLIPIKDNKVLLLRRFNTGWMDGHYSLVAGHLDGGETTFEAVARESFEEAGIKISKEDLTPVKVAHRGIKDIEYIDFFFVTEKWEGEPKIMETNKCDDLSWFPITDLPENILPYIKEVILTYKNNIPFIEFD